MFNFICGTAVGKGEGVLIVENGGIGWEIFVTNDALFKVSEGQKVQLFTYLQVKDDGLCLYGFTSKEEKAMFLKLITVGGVGCRLAMTVLSGISITNLALAVIGGDIASLTRVKGVGKKTAERIILELKEKVDGELSAAGSADGGTAAYSANPAAETAIAALVSLGISRFEAQKAVGGIASSGLTAEQLVTKALKSLN